MTANQPVIIEAAVNGATDRHRRANVPRTPTEVAEDCLATLDAGAAVLHTHIDWYHRSDEEAAERYLEGWRPVLRARPDALLYPTVNNRADGSSSYDHLVPLAESGLLRVGLADPGSVNLGYSRNGIPRGDWVYRNSFDHFANALDICRQHQLGPNLTIFEPGFLRLALAWWRAGEMPPGAMLKFYFATDEGVTGSPFGLLPTRTALDAYLELLGDCPLPWSVSIAGGDLTRSEIARTALERGGHLHLGLEFFRGSRTPTNAELVAEAVLLCEEVGRVAATPTEAAIILGLPRSAPMPAAVEGGS
jgi:uncharacterized protein (DUF849 family)